MLPGFGAVVRLRGHLEDWRPCCLAFLLWAEDRGRLGLPDFFRNICMAVLLLAGGGVSGTSLQVGALHCHQFVFSCLLQVELLAHHPQAHS